jgi:hypothetical protein
MASVRIVAVPPGEAPLHIREAWVGLELPLSRGRARASRFATYGVLSGPSGLMNELIRLLTFRFTIHNGYAVGVLAALETLEQSNPQAAHWWRINTPHLIRPQRYFLFPRDCCEFIA